MASNTVPTKPRPAPGAAPGGTGLRGFANLVGRWIAGEPPKAQPEGHSGLPGQGLQATDFPPEALPIGHWTAWRADGLGSNNLTDLELVWHPANRRGDHSLPEFAACQPSEPCGFEHYLNSLLPADHESQWKSIKAQLLTQQPVALSRVRMRIDGQIVKQVWVRRVFTFSVINGELLSLEIQLAI